MDMTIKSQITQRTVNQGMYAQAVSEGFTPLQSRIIAARIAPGQTHGTISEHIRPLLKTLTPPDMLPDIDKAATRIAEAVASPDQRIICVVDHDVDGQTAGTVLMTALIDYFGMPEDRVGIVLSHKRKEGFGVSAALSERLMAKYPAPALIITADQGSQDEERFKVLKEAGYEIIVTDHHEVHEPPASALACVNPTRDDSVFPDRFISGCHVAWLVACATRRKLMETGGLSSCPSLGGLVDYVGLSSVADSVSIAKSHNNRAVINAALAMMNNAPRPAWQAIRQVMGRDGPFEASDLAMGVGPRLNAISRMGDALPGVKFLRATDMHEALALAANADKENQKRKEIERSMTATGLIEAMRQVEKGVHTVCIHFTNGHPGVHGIVASRMVEAVGRPAVCLSPKHGQEGVLTGSLRSIPGINVHQALEAAAKSDPECMIGFGGHAGAAGVTLKIDKVAAFASAFNKAVGAQRDLTNACPVVHSDGALGEPVSMSAYQSIAALGPYGREFEQPQFEGIFEVISLRAVGDGTHLKMSLSDADGRVCDAIWFRAMDAGDPPPVAAGEQIDAIFVMAENHWKGKVKLDVQIKHARSIESCEQH